MIDVILMENSVVIDDVVVIAYGTKKRRDMIGSVSKIKSEEMSLMQGGRFENSLQGLASGVQVVNDGMRVVLHKLRFVVLALLRREVIRFGLLTVLWAEVLQW